MLTAITGVECALVNIATMYTRLQFMCQSAHQTRTARISSASWTWCDVCDV